MPIPISHHLLEPGKPATVALDGLPRVARYRTAYDDGTEGETQHVLYLENGAPPVRSMPTADWLAQRGPLPADPTQAESDAAVAAARAATQQAQADTQALRQQIIQRAQSAVGKQVDTLTAGERNTLIVALLLQADGLKPDLTIRPLADWIDRR